MLAVLSVLIALVCGLSGVALGYKALKKADRFMSEPPAWISTSLKRDENGKNLLDRAFDAFVQRIWTQPPSWLTDMFEPDEEGNTFVDSVANRFAERFATSLRMSLLATKSGEVRTQKAVDQRLFEGFLENSPELGLLTKVAKKFGFGDLITPESLPYVLKGLSKYAPALLQGGGTVGARGNHPGSGVPEM